MVQQAGINDDVFFIELWESNLNLFCTSPVQFFCDSAEGSSAIL